jgi:diguanylate cyclase (GGDEF)-like protein
MTGLPNARSLQAQFDREVARAHRAGSTFQVLMLDLDGFKKVNDTFGHKAGDRMLVGVGRAIGSQLREYDFLARYAGDEFVALIADTSSDAAKELCERIESAVSAFTIQIDEDFVSVGVSIGSATYPYSGKSFDELLIAADKGMYTAKARRKQAEARLAMIPKPDRPLEFDMSLVVDIDEIDSVFDVDETHICGIEANDVVHVEP